MEKDKGKNKGKEDTKVEELLDTCAEVIGAPGAEEYLRRIDARMAVLVKSSERQEVILRDIREELLEQGQ